MHTMGGGEGVLINQTHGYLGILDGLYCRKLSLCFNHTFKMNGGFFFLSIICFGRV